MTTLKTADPRASIKDRIMSVPEKTKKGISTNKTIAIIIWLTGAWLTGNTLSQMGVPEGAVMFVAVPLQLALTRAESPIWRGKGYPKMAIAALLIDSLIANTPGAFVYTQKIGNTDFWKMIQVLSPNPIDANIGTQFATALGVGAIIAASAEYFWNLPD